MHPSQSSDQGDKEGGRRSRVGEKTEPASGESALKGRARRVFKKLTDASVGLEARLETLSSRHGEGVLIRKNIEKGGPTGQG